jgi:hypothetical protein
MEIDARSKVVTDGKGRSPQGVRPGATAGIEDVIAETKNMAAKIKEASDLWDLERWLAQRRLEIERKYDYRYSVLPFVFATLLTEGRVNEFAFRRSAHTPFRGNGMSAYWVVSEKFSTTIYRSPPNQR